MNRKAVDVRKEVSEAYSKAAGTCCGRAARKGPAAAPGIYSGEELASVPEGASESSLGCGNPLALAGVRPGDVVLDLGSGTGLDLILAARKTGPAGRVIGIDMTDTMIARARENVRASGFGHVEVRKGLIEELPVESGSVDWVISNCVINLSPEKHRVFREIARVLRPGGRMLVSDIAARNLPDWIRGLPALHSGCLGGAVPEEEYLAGLRDAGLVDAEIRDRLVYHAVQLEALAAPEGGKGCGCAAGEERLREAARSLAGRVSSIRVYARKPE